MIKHSEKYAALADALAGAYNQAAQGKGKERHATDEAFEDQKICVISRWIQGSPVAGVLFQAVKKAVESSRLPPERAIHELRGAINYLAAGIVLLEEIVPSAASLTPSTPISTDSDSEPDHSDLAPHQDWDTKIFNWDRYCATCKFLNVLVTDMPCKKCIELSFKPHWRPLEGDRA